MKKKSVVILGLVVVLLLAVTPAVFAKQVTYYLEGVIVSIDDEAEEIITITIYNETDGEVPVKLTNYEGDLEVGYTIYLKGIYGVEYFEADEVLSLDAYLVGEIIDVEYVDPLDPESDPYAIVIDIPGLDPVTVHLPDEYPPGLDKGIFVRAHGSWVEDVGGDYFEATTIEIFEPGDDDDIPVDLGGRGGIYCDGGKDKPHPLAVKIAEQGVTEAWVMEQFCAGFGFGEIMLVLRTQTLLGDDAWWDTRAILNLRNEMGWGQIWKTLGLKKGDEESTPPPGPLSKPAQEDNQPPGWENKPEKNKDLPPGWQKKQYKHDDLPPGLQKKNNQG
jgi:hypothetical protein